MSTLAITISIGLLWGLAYCSTAALLAPLMAALVILFSGDTRLLLPIDIGLMLPVPSLTSGADHGVVIASLAGFILLRGAVLGLPDNPLISDAI